MAFPSKSLIDNSNAKAVARRFPPAEDVWAVMRSMNEEESDALYERAFKTALRLATFGRLSYLPAYSHHVSFGYYVQLYDFHECPMSATQRGRCGKIWIEGRTMIIDTYRRTGDINKPLRYEVAVDLDTHQAFATWDPLYRKWFEIVGDFGRRMALLNCDRTLGLFDDRDVEAIAFYNVACKLRAKLLRDDFKKEIEAEQEREVTRAIKGTRLYYDQHARLRFSRQIAAGSYSAVKNEIRNAKRYKFTSTNSGGTQSQSRQQLRALGIVA